MERERMPGTCAPPPDLAANRRARRRDHRHHDRMIDPARLEIGDETMVIGVVRIQVEALVHCGRRPEQRDDQDLSQGKPHQRRKNSRPPLLDHA